MIVGYVLPGAPVSPTISNAAPQSFLTAFQFQFELNLKMLVRIHLDASYRIMHAYTAHRMF